MARGRLYCLAVFFFPSLLAISLFAQKGGQASSQGNPQTGQASSASQGTAGQGLQGFSFAPEEWRELTLPDVTNPVRTVGGRTVLCYKLTKANSSTQPFILQRIKLPNEVVGTGFDRPCGKAGTGETDREGRKDCIKNPQPDEHWNVCSTLDETHPILMGQQLVIGIDVSDLSATGVNINQIKLLNVNVTSQQSSPINPSPIRPSFPGTAAGGATTSLGSAGEAEQSDASGGWWTSLLNRPAGWDGHNTWEAGKIYHQGDIVADWSLTRFYRANQKCFNSGPVLIDPFPRQQGPDWVQDGAVIWEEMNEPKAVETQVVKLWKSQTKYETGAIVKVARGGAGPIRNTQLIEFLQQGISFATSLATSPAVAQIPNDLTKLTSKQLVDLIQAVPTITLAKSQSVAQIPDDRTKLTSKEFVDMVKAVPSASCEAPSIKEDKWHYYWAVRGGVSGLVPRDPFSVALLPRAIYVPWPYQLPGDIIPNVSVNIVYSPSVPGGPWQGNTFYPAGSVVTSTANSGHYYTAITGGFSSPEPNEPDFPTDAPPTVQDGTLVWLDSGVSAPSVSAASSQPAGQGSGGGAQGSGGSAGGKPQQWLANSHYLVGDVVLDPYNGHYYAMIKSVGGLSGQASAGKPDPFQPLPSTATIRDGELLWLPLPPGTTSRESWQAGGHYSLGQVVNINGSYYKVIGSTATAGKSGDRFHTPKNLNERLTDGDVVWQDYGAAKPGVQGWNPNHPYSFGEAISNGGELYVMIGTSAGNAGPIEPVTPNPSGRPTTLSDGDLLWMATGLSQSGCTVGSASWIPNHPYTLGAKVFSSSDCQIYEMIRYIAGASGPSPRSPFPVLSANGPSNTHPYPRRISDGTVIWEATSASATSTTPVPWAANARFEEGKIAYAVDDTEHQLWIAKKSGMSGPTPAQPAFPVFEPHAVIEPKSEIAFGTPVWQDSGVIRPAGLPPGDPSWSPVITYALGNVVYVPGPGNGRYYTALSQNKGKDPRSSPMSLQNFPMGYPKLPLTWQDTGTTAPAVVAGGLPADQTVSLQNAPLPQTHSLSYFNIASGFVVSFVRPSTFGYTFSSNVKLPAGFVPATTGPATTNLAVDPTTGCTISTTKDSAGNTPVYYCPIKIGHTSYPVDPVLGMTVYYPPIDAEVPFRWGNPRNWIPGAGVAFSLANPTSNFYVGGSNEFLVRNVQVYYGLAFLKVPVGLNAPASQPVWGGVGTAPMVSTKQGFQKGFFTGFTFNLSGFIQSLGFGGSKASGQ